MFLALKRYHCLLSDFVQSVVWYNLTDALQHDWHCILLIYNCQLKRVRFTHKVIIV